MSLAALVAKPPAHVRLIGVISAAHFTSHIYILILAPLLPLADEVFAVAPAIDRALPAGELASFCGSLGARAREAGSVALGIALARQAASSQGNRGGSASSSGRTWISVPGSPMATLSASRVEA